MALWSILLLSFTVYASPFLKILRFGKNTGLPRVKYCPEYATLLFAPPLQQVRPSSL